MNWCTYEFKESMATWTITMHARDGIPVLSREVNMMFHTNQAAICNQSLVSNGKLIMFPYMFHGDYPQHSKAGPQHRTISTTQKKTHNFFVCVGVVFFHLILCGKFWLAVVLFVCFCFCFERDGIEMGERREGGPGKTLGMEKSWLKIFKQKWIKKSMHSCDKGMQVFNKTVW